MSPDLPPIVIVTWLDAHADRSGGWCQRADMDDDPYRVTSVGWLIDPKPGHLSLAQSRGDDDALDHVLHVPTGMVVRVVNVSAP